MSMKRIFSLAMAATMLFSVTAYGATVDEAAAELNVPILTDKETGKYSLPTYTTVTDGKEYMIWVVKGVHTQTNSVSFGQSDVLYINQNTATSSGVTFDAFLPMETEDSTVLITGQGGPKIVGYIEGEENPKGSVSGTITSYLSDTDAITIQLFKEGAETAAYTETTTTGAYSIENVEAGSYTMKVSKANHVTREYAVTVAGGAIDQVVRICTEGDVDMNGVVNIIDHQCLFEHLQGITTITDEYQLKIANVKDTDTIINIIDHQCLFEHLQGINPLF